MRALDDENVESFKTEIASLLLMIHDHYLRHLVGYDITLALSRLVHSMGLQTEISILDVERMRHQVMGQSSYPMEFDAFFAWLRSLSIFLYKNRDIGGRMAFHTFLVEHLVPSVSECDYTESASGSSAIQKEDGPLKLLTVDAWLLYGTIDEFLHVFFCSLTDESLKVVNSNFEQISLWKRSMDNTNDSRIDSERLMMSLKLNGVVPVLVSEDDVDQCMSLAVNDDQNQSRLTLQQLLYTLELLADRMDITSLNDTAVNINQHRLHILLQELSTNMLKNRIWSFYIDLDKQFSKSQSHLATSNPSVTVVATIMSIIRQAGIFSVSCQNITLYFQNSYQSFGHLLRLQQMRFRDEDAINQGWISFFNALMEDIQSVAGIELVTNVKHHNVSKISALIFALVEYTPGLFFATKSSMNMNSLVPFTKLSTAESLDRFWSRVWELTQGIIENIQHLQGGQFTGRSLYRFPQHRQQTRMAISVSELRELLIDGKVLQQSPHGSGLSEETVEYLYEKAVFMVTSGVRADEDPIFAPLHMIELICVVFSLLRKRQKRQQSDTDDIDTFVPLTLESIEEDRKIDVEAMGDESEDDMAFLEVLFQLRESTEVAMLENEAPNDNEPVEDVSNNSGYENSVEELHSVDSRMRVLPSREPIAVASKALSDSTYASNDTTSNDNQSSGTFKAKRIAEIKNLALSTQEEDDVVDDARQKLSFRVNNGIIPLSPLVIPPAPTPPAHKHHTRHRRQSFSSDIIQTISELVRLLMHFPSLGFDPTPWQIYHIYVELLSEEMERQFSTTAPPAADYDDDGRRESGSNDRDATSGDVSNKIIMKLLKILAERFDLSPAVFSTFFAPYYAASGSFLSILPFETPSIADVLQTSFFNLFASDNVQRLLSLNADLLKWEFTRCISCCRNSKEPFTQSLLFNMVSQSLAETAQDRYHQNMLLDYQQVAFWIGQYIKDPALQLSTSSATTSFDSPFLMEYIVTSALSGLPLSFQEESVATTASSSSAVTTKLPRLTFSTFVIFAIRCFTKHLFISSSSSSSLLNQYTPGNEGEEGFHHNMHEVQITEKQFLDEIRRMLRMFSTNLTNVQRVVEIHILDFLFDASFLHGNHSSSSSDEEEDDDESDGSRPLRETKSSDVVTKPKFYQRLQQKQRLLSQFVTKTILFSHRVFDQRIQSLSLPSSSSTTWKVPPRPPPFLWDAARFVEFVRFFHLIERPCSVVSTGQVPKSKLFQPSMTQAWTVYGYYLYQDMQGIPDMYTQLSQTFVREGHVPPLPMDIDDDKIIELLQLQAFLTDKHGVLSTSSLSAALSTYRQYHHHAHAGDVGSSAVKKPILYEAGLSLIQEDLFPMICSFAESMASQPQQGHVHKPYLANQADGYALEDLLRLGGSVMMVKLSELQSFLQLSFYCLARSASTFLGQASSTLGEPSAIVLKHIPSGQEEDATSTSKTASLYEKYGGCSLEIPINVACDFFSCRELIGAAKVAFLARESLHHRLRPPYALVDPVVPMDPSNASSPSDTVSSAHAASPVRATYRSVVTMNYAEFEELFVRASFQIAQQNTQRTMTTTSAFATNPATKQAYEVYQQEEKRVQSVTATTTGQWGRDYLSPYAAILQQYFQFPVVYIEDFQRLSGFQIPQIKHMAHFLHKSYQLVRQKVASEEKEQQDQQEKPSSLASSSIDAIENIANHNFSHLIADPVTRNPSFTAHSNTAKATNSNGNGNGKKKLHFSDETGAPLAFYQSPTSSKTKAFVGSGHGVASAGYDPSRPPEWATTHPSDVSSGLPSLQQSAVAATGAAFEHAKIVSHVASGTTASASAAAAASTNTSNSSTSKTSFLSALQYIPLSPSVKQQFVHDIKESLWPVFATYCSCGDSTDPGRLSCPNLFTLLSKLGLLDDNTLVSDIGRIFYRIATKSFSRESASWSFRQLARHQRRSYQKHLKQQQEQQQQQQQANAGTRARRFLASSSSGSSDSVRWIQQHGLIFEEFLLFVYAFAQLRYEQRYDLLQDEENRDSCYQSIVRESSHLHSQQQSADSGTEELGDLFSATNGATATADSASGDQQHILSMIYATLPKKWHFWYDKMTASVSFQRLFYEYIQPRLTTQSTLLAVPEDARYRDRFTSVFAEEVLEIIERVEGPLSALFSQELSSLESSSSSSSAAQFADSLHHNHNHNHNHNHSSPLEKKIPIIVRALRRLELLPQVISEKQVAQLIRDVVPEDLHASLSSSPAAEMMGAIIRHSPVDSTAAQQDHNVHGNGDVKAVAGGERMVFPQWMWILCVVALQAVRQAISREQQQQQQQQQQQASRKGEADQEDDERVAYLVGRVVISITMTLTTTNPSSSSP